uniref:Lysosomal Pro-X carboxypeptidase n=1 Tax=Quercus lobata TaxID=97700 RepID=A0A7N2LA90_QUELO
MKSPMFSFQWLPFVFLIFLSSVSATLINNIPRFSPIGGNFLHDLETVSASISDDLQTFYYDQTLDHFNYRPESYTTFQQRYVINSKYWGGATSNAPILAYFGAEAPLDGDLSAIGFLADNAQQFQALILYIEHRYYGKSIPFRTREEAHVKETLHGNNSPVIVIGGSYGGMLASWFRLKYPHVALGALASSAPILYFDDITPQNGYFSIVSKDFKEASETCYQTIKKSWSEIDKAASQPSGLSNLSKEFKTCRPLSKSSKLKAYLGIMYVCAAQYNHPLDYPVTIVCGGIDGAPSNASILQKIFPGLVAYGGISSCYFNEPKNISKTTMGWNWQVK